MDSNDTNSRIPELRFPGFEGEWEEKSFGELYEKHNVKNDLSFGVDKIISVANMYYKGDAAVGDDDYLKTYNVFRLGDIAYEGNKSANYAYGRFVENTIGDGIVSHVFDVYSPISSNHCIDYWKYAINYERIMRPILEKSTIKSTMMTNLIAKDFLKQKILVPPTFAEQQKIADCLSSMDNLIQEEADQLQTLKDHKKGLMQQLFPQDGETTPKRRFPGFEGEWEEKKLGELCESILVGFPFKGQDITDNVAGRPILRACSIGEGIIRHGKDYDKYYPNDATPLEKYKVKCDDIVISMDGSVGKNIAMVSKAEEDYLLIQRVARIRIKDYPIQLIYQQIISQRFKDYAAGEKVGAVIAHISQKQIESFPVYVPSTRPEQQKIADCLSSLDEEISAQQQKIEALKEHKKGLMQNLFPIIN